MRWSHVRLSFIQQEIHYYYVFLFLLEDWLCFQSFEQQAIIAMTLKSRLKEITGTQHSAGALLSIAISVNEKCQAGEDIKRYNLNGKYNVNCELFNESVNDLIFFSILRLWWYDIVIVWSVTLNTMKLLVHLLLMWNESNFHR